MAPRISWEGVFPAVTTQFRDDISLDIEATRRVMDALIVDGVSGLIVCGTVGENTSLTRPEKVAIMEAAKDVARGRVPVIAGIAEFTTPFAVETAKEAQRIGIDGVMVMPALVYSSKPHETAAHFRGVAKATDLPVMVYNNPPIYKNDVTPAILASLADCETIVCFKESFGRHAPLHRRAQHGRRPLRDVRRPRRRGGRERHGRRRRLGFGNVECLPARRRDPVPPRARRPLCGGDAALRMVHAASAPRCPPGPRAVHQALRAHHGPRNASDAPAAPVA